MQYVWTVDRGWLTSEEKAIMVAEHMMNEAATLRQQELREAYERGVADARLSGNRFALELARDLGRALVVSLAVLGALCLGRYVYVMGGWGA